ncbi:MAG: hypothetical protein OER04_03470 [Cyclobacteriaceae bacterium]|nr:hypothetical protein [Cyclobacteriaceae bacterium]
MSELLKLKEQAHDQCVLWVQQKIDILQQSIRQTRQSASAETKSSMGDKYETAQAMLHLEKEKYQSQLQQVLKLERVLHQISISANHTKIDLGSFLDTDQGYFYLSIAAGELPLGQTSFIAISPASPLGLEFKQAAVDTPFNFRGRSYLIHQFC